MREREGVNREGVASRIQNNLILMGRKAGKLAGGQMIFFFLVYVGDAIGTTGSDPLVQIHRDQTGPKNFWDQRIRTRKWRGASHLVLIPFVVSFGLWALV
jgi:hypothetical protein